MNSFTKALKKAGNAVADVLPKIGSVKVDNASNPASAYSMMKRKQKSAGPAGTFKIPK